MSGVNQLHSSKLFPDRNLGREGLHWTPESEAVVQNIGIETRCRKDKQMQAARRMRCKYNLLIYTSIILGPMSAVVSGIGVSLNPEEPSFFPIIASIIAFVSGVLSAIVKFSRLDEQSSEHKRAANLYKRLENSVRIQLTLPRNIRDPVTEYLRSVQYTLEEITKCAPLLSTSIHTDGEFVVNTGTVGTAVQIDPVLSPMSYGQEYARRVPEGLVVLQHERSTRDWLRSNQTPDDAGHRESTEESET